MSKLRSLGAHYLQQSVCLLPATARTLRVATRLIGRLRPDGGHGLVLRIQLTDARPEREIVEAFRRQRSDEYNEVVERTEQFHQELAHERDRGRASYTELEESDTDLARHQKWLAAARDRDYFGAPGAKEAIAAVAVCEQALAQFAAEALATELDRDSPEAATPRLRAIDGGSQ